MAKSLDKIDIYSHLVDLFKAHKHLNKREKLALLIKLEITRILTDINDKRDILYKLWSKERTRKPLISVLSSKFYELSFSELMLLGTDTNVALDEFYKVLNDFKFYVSYTEDMPQTMKNNFDMHFNLLNTVAQKAIFELNKELETKGE